MMEPNGLGGGMFPGMSSGLLGGVENVPNPQNQNPHSMHHHHPQMVPYASSHLDTDIPQSIKQVQGYPYSAKPKQQSTLSDEDEMGGFAADDVSSGDPKRGKMSQWHRMKWTDTMVKLLIMAVFYIGDEGGSEGGDNKKKPIMGLLQQKKGKWKAVSRAMMEKGFFVSPQQCEDKFNDLNKRYKRVNDILGKGTACLVVENNNLLDTMDLSPKMKEEVRKLLNSKHLFFKEMCAYHNSCGHGSTSGVPQQSSEVGTEQHQQQKCSHASEIGVANLGRSSRKRAKKSELMQQMSSEMMGVLQDGGRNTWEKRQWMKRRLIQLEEQQISYQTQAFELEKQKLKWMRFSRKKEREMERAKLENERRQLENERMALVIRQKEIELLNLQHHQQQQHSSN
ncbi:ESF1-like protein [Senna tora]|uniref:ESF1-like protein n=1 Tax=Senna tora TaxID=362788 RepID=A0A834TCP2_9FABA|nr:ESF1-like protein [Senna tora]